MGRQAGAGRDRLDDVSAVLTGTDGRCIKCQPWFEPEELQAELDALL